MKIISIVAVFLVMQLPVFGSGKPEKKQVKRMYQTSRIACESMPRIDGILSEECWNEGQWTGDFVQRIPKGGEQPSQKTQFKILYDKNNLYIAFKCYDTDPSKITRLIGKRDELKGDAVGIAFDSYHDQRTAFEFDVTAAGGKTDMIGTDDGQSWNFNWNAVWYAKTAVNDSGWTVEIQIPFNQLRFSESEMQTWGMHVTRRIFRNNEEDNWQLIPIDAPGMVHLFGELHGIENISKSSRIEFMPYTVAKMRFNKPVAGNPFATGRSSSLNGGFDAKIGLSSNFTLDLTVNPDFGQVESDPALLNLTVFEPSFEEKRPFFIEGANMLQSNVSAGSLFYSRRIGAAPKFSSVLASGEYANTPTETSILSAAKITGKTKDGMSVGILQCLTANEYSTIRHTDGNDSHQKVQPLTSYTVAQVKQDMNSGNTVIGGIFTSTNRIFDDKQLNFLTRNAYTGGVNFLQQFCDKTYYLKFAFAGSYINGDSTAMIRQQRSSARYFQRPDDPSRRLDSSMRSMAGTASDLTFGKQGNGHWFYYERIRFSSPMFEPNDLGFNLRSDFYEQKTSVSYKENYANRFYSKYSFYGEQVCQWDFTGKNINNYAEIYADLIFKNYQEVSAGVVHYYNQNDARILRGGPMMKLPSYLNTYFDINTDERKKVYGAFHYGHFTYQDGISQSSNYTFSLNWKAGHAVTLGSAFTYLPVVNDYQYVTSNNGKYILGNLDQKTAYLTLRVGVYITPEISIQYYGNPYFSVGRYTNFKKVVNPMADDYQSRFAYYSKDEISMADNKYTLTDASDGSATTFTNPDFQYREFHSNLVFRWEFRPSSNIYLVWTHGRSEYQNVSDFSMSRTASGLFSIYPENIFLIKFNYWFSL